MLLKQLVHRQWNGDPALLFPSGHVAVATAAAMTAVLVLRVVPVAPPARVAAACLGGGFVLVIAVARLVETVHPLTDVVGGATTGLVVTLGAASAITTLWRLALCGRARLRACLRRLVEVDDSARPRRRPEPVVGGRLQPGERVRVERREEIVATLDANNANRGMSFDGEMLRYCGQEARVLRRVERIIDEMSGVVSPFIGTLLAILNRRCPAGVPPPVPSGHLPVWREIWLERVE